MKGDNVELQKYIRLCLELLAVLILAVVFKAGFDNGESYASAADLDGMTKPAEYFDFGQSILKNSRNLLTLARIRKNLEQMQEKLTVAELDSLVREGTDSYVLDEHPELKEGLEELENPEKDEEQQALEEDGADAGAAVLAVYAEGIAAEIKSNPAYYDYKVYRSAISEAEEIYGKNGIPDTARIPLENDDERYKYITGLEEQTYTINNMPAGYRTDAEAKQQMVTFSVPIWQMGTDGKRIPSTHRLTVNSRLAESVKCIFTEIYDLEIQFPINYLSGYSYRKVGGSGLEDSRLMSAHSFGVAIDINNGDYDNDYFLGAGNDLRNKDNPFCIPDSVIAIFEKYGWFWGGNFSICSDTMHFQYFGLDFLQYTSEEPFPILSYRRKGMDSVHIRNLIQRLQRLGYLEKSGSKFTLEVENAVKKFQTDNQLKPDGIVDYETWVPLINATHDMQYTF